LVLVGSLHNQVLDNAVRAVDVFQGAMTQSVSKPVVLFFREVTMCLVEQFERSVITACVSKVRIDWRMIVQILPVINRGALNFADGLVDLGDGVFFLAVHMTGVGLMLQMSTRMAQVSQRVQVSRMSSRIVCEGHRGANGNAECDYCAIS